MLTFNVAAQDKDQSLFLLRIHHGELTASELVKQAEEFNSRDLEKFIQIILMPEGKAAVEMLIPLEESTKNQAVKEAALYRLANYYNLIDNSIKYKTYYDKLKKEFPDSEYLAFLGGKKGGDETAAKKTDSEGSKGDKKDKSDEKVKHKSDTDKPVKDKAKSAGDWYIQVAAYTNEKKAKETIKKLEKNGYDVIRTQGKLKGKDYIFISVGYYKKKDDAKSDASKIEKLLKTEVLVKKRS